MEHFLLWYVWDISRTKVASAAKQECYWLISIHTLLRHISGSTSKPEKHFGAYPYKILCIVVFLGLRGVKNQRKTSAAEWTSYVKSFTVVDWPRQITSLSASTWSDPLSDETWTWSLLYAIVTFGTQYLTLVVCCSHMWYLPAPPNFLFDILFRKKFNVLSSSMS